MAEFSWHFFGRSDYSDTGTALARPKLKCCQNVLSGCACGLPSTVYVSFVMTDVGTTSERLVVDVGILSECRRRNVAVGMSQFCRDACVQLMVCLGVRVTHPCVFFIRLLLVCHGSCPLAHQVLGKTPECHSEFVRSLFGILTNFFTVRER